jgi:hypothetical protein
MARLTSSENRNPAKPGGTTGFISIFGGCVTGSIDGDSWATLPFVDVRGRADRRAGFSLVVTRILSLPGTTLTTHAQRKSLAYEHI